MPCVAASRVCQAAEGSNHAEQPGCTVNELIAWFLAGLNQESEQGDGGDEGETTYLDAGNVLWAGIFGERGKLVGWDELDNYGEEVAEEGYCELPVYGVEKDAPRCFQSFQHQSNLADSGKKG